MSVHTTFFILALTRGKETQEGKERLMKELRRQGNTEMDGGPMLQLGVIQSSIPHAHTDIKEDRQNKISATNQFSE